MSETASPSDFTELVGDVDAPADASGVEYSLGDRFGLGYVAKGRAAEHALVVQLPGLDASVVGRRGAGCALIPHPMLRFAHGGRTWTAPGAALLCTDAELVDAFHVLVTDVARRAEASWGSLVGLVEEWQALLSPRREVSAEHELGLWGELWVIDAATKPETLLAGWRGPDRDAMDFFVDGIALEVKATRQKRVHHVSRTQVDEPAGAHESLLLSIHVASDPIRGIAVPALVDRVLSRVPDPCAALRCVARAGYAPADRSRYLAPFTVLSEPEWYAIDDVPRVHVVDPGVSQLRYRVTLDEAKRVTGDDVARLWTHFHGRGYGGERR